jgi:hypothetical protein
VLHFPSLPSGLRQPCGENACPAFPRWRQPLRPAAPAQEHCFSDHDPPPLLAAW